jgi:hypothetical protein
MSVDDCPLPMYMNRGEPRPHGRKMMKELATILLTSAVLAWLPATAVRSIDAQPKEQPAATTPDGSDTSDAVAPQGAEADTASGPSVKRQAMGKGAKGHSSRKALLERLKRKVREAQKEEQPQYDHLIDTDNDGVDDRVEAAKPPTGASEPVERKRRADSTGKAPPH